MTNLIVGLGNPGAKYENNRHNVGFMVAHSICTAWQFYPTMKFGYVPRSLDVVIIPLTFMNTSGIPVARMSQGFYIEPANIIVVHDDMDLPFGTMRIKARGSDGGHRGIRSIIKELGTTDFVRVKVGIGHPPEGISVLDYVLSDFAEEEQEILPTLIKKGRKAIELIVQEGVESAQNEVNGVE